MLNKNINTIIHVCSQDPRCQTGGQGITVENQCREQLFLGYQVYWISCRVKGLPEYENISYQHKKLKVARISCFDSDKIVTPYQGDEELQYRRRREFGKKFVQFIKKHFSPQKIVIHLHGFYIIPLMARELKEYNTCAQYHLFLSKRMEQLGKKDKMHHIICRLEQESLKANKKILALSPGFKKEMLEICPQIKNKIYLMPNGIENFYVEPPFYPLAKKFRVLAWGRIAPEKNFESIIKTLDCIPKPIDCLIFGKTDNTEDYRKKYYQKLLKLKLARGKSNLQIKVKNAGIRGEEKIKLIDSCNLVIVPSLYESFGLVILEAMARGKPVIASPLPGPAYIFKTTKKGLNNYGYICDPTPANLAYAIEMFYNDKNLLRQTSLNCQARAKNFLWSKLIIKLMQIYQK